MLLLEVEVGLVYGIQSIQELQEVQAMCSDVVLIEVEVVILTMVGPEAIVLGVMLLLLVLLLVLADGELGVAELILHDLVVLGGVQLAVSGVLLDH